MFLVFYFPIWNNFRFTESEKKKKKSDSCDPMGYSPQAPLSMEFFRQEYWNGNCHALLQRIFPTWGWNLRLLHCKWILYHLSHRESPQIYWKVAKLVQRGPICSPYSHHLCQQPLYLVLLKTAINTDAMLLANYKLVFHKCFQ